MCVLASGPGELGRGPLAAFTPLGLLSEETQNHPDTSNLGGVLALSLIFSICSECEDDQDVPISAVEFLGHPKSNLTP